MACRVLFCLEELWLGVLLMPSWSRERLAQENQDWPTWRTLVWKALFLCIKLLCKQIKVWKLVICLGIQYKSSALSNRVVTNWVLMLTLVLVLRGYDLPARFKWVYHLQPINILIKSSLLYNYVEFLDAMIQIAFHGCIQNSMPDLHVSKSGELHQRWVGLGACKADIHMSDRSGVCGRHFSTLNILLILASLKILKSERPCDELPKFTF